MPHDTADKNSLDGRRTSLMRVRGGARLENLFVGISTFLWTRWFDTLKQIYTYGTPMSQMNKPHEPSRRSRIEKELPEMRKLLAEEITDMVTSPKYACFTLPTDAPERIMSGKPIPDINLFYEAAERIATKFGLAAQRRKEWFERVFGEAMKHRLGGWGKFIDWSEREK